MSSLNFPPRAPHLILLASTLVLSGCISSKAYLNENLPAYQGKPSDELVYMLGEPTSSEVVDGKTSLNWENTKIEEREIDPVGASFGNFFFSQAFTIKKEHHCKISVQASEDNIVETFEIVGTSYACTRFSDNFKEKVAEEEARLQAEADAAEAEALEREGVEESDS